MSKKNNEPMKDPRFSEVEITLLRTLEEEPIKLLRKIFYQEVLSEGELEMAKSLATPDMVSVLKKFFTPELDWQAPVFSMPNRWTQPRFDQMLMTECKPIVIGRQIAIRFLENGIKRLELIRNGDNSVFVCEIDLKMKGDYQNQSPETVKIQVFAMQEAIQLLESGILAIYSYSANKEKLEDIVSRLKKDSTR